ncbi:MAG: S46 family peptidase [Bacteroidetes bacterium]|nr:S46 family peptidase [Bacteroidota bacterium]
MKRLFLVILISLFWIIPSGAQEGMWIFTQLNKLDLKKKGLQIPVNQVYSPDKPSIADAVVQLGGGTASFVSPEGLLITNHHVAYTALQRNSSVSSDYLTKGFLAKDRSEEIQAPGYEALLMTKMKDVTAEILQAAKGIQDPVQRNKTIETKIAAMTDSLEKDKDDIRATIAPMYNGKQYILYVYKVFKDIRIVYSPPLAIGKFGGEIDNWMWPRHTGDFSFMRVYVSPEGKGKEFDKNNIPYKPKVWLKTAGRNLRDGDFTFIIGYPGFTTRYRTSNSANWNYKYNFPSAIKNFEEVISLLDETTKNDPEGKLKVANQKTGLANVLKNYQGQVEAMNKINFVQKKLDFEKEMMEWVDKDPARKEKYGNILNDIKALYAELAKTRERDNVFGITAGFGGVPLGTAILIYGTVKEREKPEAERQPGLTEKNIERIVDNLKFQYADYYEPVEKALMIRALKMADELTADQRITVLENILRSPSKTIEQFVDEAFKTSKLLNLEYAQSLFKKSSVELDTLNDPFINIAKLTYPLSEEIAKTNENFAAKVTELRKQYIDALYEWKGTNLYPDANRTVRFTYGTVKGYSPADAVLYRPFTTLRGVIEKNTGVEPFDVPPGLSELYKKKDYEKFMDPLLKDVPVAFTHLGDITGGNSGSPVMNARGEIVGVAFDGNYEAMISDWQYDGELQRVISVDIRYVLFITQKYAGADFILKEMGVIK